jgi:hypothetical protein
MLSFPSLIPVPLALIPDAHNCISFVPRNNSLHILFSTLYFLSPIRSAKNSNKVTLIHPALPVLSLRINPGQSSDINPCHHNELSLLLISLSPFYPITFYLILLFVSHSFFFRGTKLVPEGDTPSSATLSTTHCSLLSPVPVRLPPFFGGWGFLCSLPPIRFFFDTRNEYRAPHGIANWTRVFLSGIITSLYPRICLKWGNPGKQAHKIPWRHLITWMRSNTFSRN